MIKKIKDTIYKNVLHEVKWWFLASSLYFKTLHSYCVGPADKKSTRSELNLQPVYQTSIGNVTEVPDKGIVWSVTVNVSSRCTLTAQIESVQNKILYLTNTIDQLRSSILIFGFHSFNGDILCIFHHSCIFNSWFKLWRVVIDINYFYRDISCWW